ncbi:TPA: hypothetical protein ACK3Q6_003179 [Burkholderia cepacia]|uniref:Uncharacterized protein n=1 Tax=Burkholderia cenocepacia TaxID=95486 RepID=A0ABD4UDC3_9BURK|nr:MULTISPECIES: hypothetical protein [Burkholderia]HDR9762882.1 hypothetical protein [Burkholderia cepacia ATCC 25416]MCA8361659.1 hypothetical protein [Burkholderia cepacia]MCW3498763.1 hypothetical protein [Burkholderia cenocepacia]MCW3506149.1 hypothetical protein [Burkholderia cenocepacia]MCW3513916.1 hypothetical protein [Burkholderia cenocepacia]
MLDHFTHRSTNLQVDAIHYWKAMFYGGGSVFSLIFFAGAVGSANEVLSGRVAPTTFAVMIPVAFAAIGIGCFAVGRWIARHPPLSKKQRAYYKKEGLIR